LSSVCDFYPRFQFGVSQDASSSSVPVALFRAARYRKRSLQNGEDTRVCSEKVCAKAPSLLARARTPKPCDARARNSLIVSCTAGGPSAGVGRGPQAGPDGSAISIAATSHLRYGAAAAFCVCNYMIMILKQHDLPTSNDHDIMLLIPAITLQLEDTVT
jgi:hypothetical protein